VRSRGREVTVTETTYAQDTASADQRVLLSIRSANPGADRRLAPHHNADVVTYRVPRGVPRPSQVPARLAPDGATPRLVSRVQSKLMVGQVDDPLEDEADRVAEHVMRIAEPQVAVGSQQVSPECSGCGEEEEGSRRLQAKRALPEAEAGEVPAAVTALLQSPGRPLEPGAREFMEPRLGRDLSDVRIHTGPSASHAAEAVTARAYTVGRNVVFRQGEYAPDTTEGRRLLAHELAHVLQQHPAQPAPRTLRPSRVTAAGGRVQRQDDGPTQDTGQAAATSESADSESVAGMDTIGRLTEAITDAGKYLPGELMDQLNELLSPASLAIMAAFVVAQAFGAGELADLAGLALLAYKIGGDAVVVAKDLYDFFSLAIGGQTKNDLDQAGSHLAHAITLAGVDILLVFLAAKEGSEEKGDTGEGEGKGETGDEQGGGAREEPLASEDLDGVMTDEDIHPEDETEPEPVSEPDLDPAVCFPAGTSVATPSGPRPIEQLRPGDEVLSFDYQAGKILVAAIAGATSGRTSRWVRLDAGSAVLRATASHRFWVCSKQDWCRADDLVPGMTLLSCDGRTLEIRDVSTYLVESTEATYNLSVPGTENYFVGEAAILVHNITLSRFNWLSRPGYRNYVLIDANGRIYYSGMFGPGVTQAQVAARHAANHDRFDPATDQLEALPGTREYGDARLLEQQVAEDNKTIDLSEPDTYRCNRQNPLAADKVPEYQEYLEVKAGCA